ncbi:hypothetical protein ACFWUW_32540, partial [Streptomyces sp. NPDC058655]|uniref:hypothetical protein n=1 Tax=Streptomyces sp. NPDC058655 TaxID=3346577 RepID=UPI0036533D49
SYYFVEVLFFFVFFFGVFFFFLIIADFDRGFRAGRARGGGGPLRLSGLPLLAGNSDRSSLMCAGQSANERKFWHAVPC